MRLMDGWARISRPTPSQIPDLTTFPEHGKGGLLSETSGIGTMQFYNAFPLTTPSNMNRTNPPTTEVI